jgi:hypothetical protein
MFGQKLKLSDELAEKLRVAAGIAGAASMEEFATRLLEVGAAQVLASTGKREASKEEVEEIANSLKGLGYLE